MAARSFFQVPALAFALGAAACQGEATTSLSDAGAADATGDTAAIDAGRSEAGDTSSACSSGTLPCPGCELFAAHVDRALRCVRATVAIGCVDRVPAASILTCVADAMGELFVLSQQRPPPPGYRICTKEEEALALPLAGSDVECEAGGG